MSLAYDYDGEEILNVFQEDGHYLENEEKYNQIKSGEYMGTVRPNQRKVIYNKPEHLFFPTKKSCSGGIQTHAILSVYGGEWTQTLVHNAVFSLKHGNMEERHTEISAMKLIIILGHRW